MRKIYEVKTYDFQGNFKKQVNPRDITSDIAFSENINGTQGILTLSIVGQVEDFKEGDIVEVREMQEGTSPTTMYWDDDGIWNDTEIWWDEIPNITETYTGIIERIGIEEYEDKEVLNLEILGTATALNDILYRSGGLHFFTKTDTFGNIAKDIIDCFNSQYGVLSGDTQNIGTSLFHYDSESIDTIGDTISIDFDHINCYKALETIIQDTDYYFFIDATGKVFFKQLGEEKVMTFRREIIKINRKSKKDEMVNRFYLHRNTGHGGELVYNNTTSQAEYGLKELHEDRTEIKDTPTQDIIGNLKVSEYGDPRIETNVIIKSQTSNTLYPGMLLTTQNTKTEINSQKITKIDKKRDFWTVYLGDYTSIGKVL